MDSDQFLLRIDALALDASIGIYPQERAQRQLVLADLELVFSAVSAAWSDEISHTIDYDEVLACVNELIASRHFNLLETLAQPMLDVVQERFSVERMMVTLSKPAASGSTRRISVTKAMAPRKIRRWGRTTRQVFALLMRKPQPGRRGVPCTYFFGVSGATSSGGLFCSSSAGSGSMTLTGASFGWRNPSARR